MKRRWLSVFILVGLLILVGAGCIPDAVFTVEATPVKPTPSPVKPAQEQSPEPSRTPPASATPARPRPVYTGPVDANFNSLSQPRYAAATAYIPATDQWMLVGGQADFLTLTGAVDLLDAGAGVISPLTTLPVSLTEAAAVYAPTTGRVYVFGGSTSSIVSEGLVTTIYAIDPASATVTLLPATLPYLAASQGVVYHPGLDRIYLFGGLCFGSILYNVWVFDPATETLTPASFNLPEAIQETSAVYSDATGKVYLFGGSLELYWTDAIYAVTFGADGLSGDVRLLPTALPQKTAALGAALDSQTQLIYLAGGGDQERLWVFDPLTEEVWETQVTLPQTLTDPAVAFSSARRHLLIVGGSKDVGNVWRIPLGAGSQ